MTARLLPTAFDSPPADPGEVWTGNASPPVVLATVALSNLDSFAAAATPGSGGDWVVWTEPGSSVKVRWLDQATGGPVGEPLLLAEDLGLHHSNVKAAGDGTEAWVIWRPYANEAVFTNHGAVLEKTAAGPRIKALFTIPNDFQLTFVPQRAMADA